MSSDSGQQEPPPDSLPPDEAQQLAASPLPALVPLPPRDDPWVAEAVKAVEASINKLVDEFRYYPYAHRVEHSLHARLIELLREWDHLRGWHPLRDGGFKSQLVHKEWPETRPEPGHGRGSFDIAIVTPGQLAQASVEQFQRGRIAAPIVIEMGLGYWDDHLRQDKQKLEDSKVPHGYLVHLSRMRSSKRPATEALINSMAEGPTQVVYVHHEFEAKTPHRHTVYHRHLRRATIDESPYRPI